MPQLNKCIKWLILVQLGCFDIRSNSDRPFMLGCTEVRFGSVSVFGPSSNSAKNKSLPPLAQMSTDSFRLGIPVANRQFRSISVPIELTAFRNNL